MNGGYYNSKVRLEKLQSYLYSAIYIFICKAALQKYKKIQKFKFWRKNTQKGTQPHQGDAN